LFACALLAATLLGGCTGAPPTLTPPASPSPTLTAGATPPAPTTAPATPTLTASPTPSPAPAAFPLSLVDDEGTAVELAAEPRRVISLAPSFTEIVFALGAGDRLVGDTDYDDYPPAAIGLPHVASYTGVDIEKVVSLQPDLVLAGGNDLTARADVERLRQLGLPVLVTYPPTVSAVLDDITLIGRALGEQQAGQALSQSMQQDMAATTAALAGLARPRVFYEIGYQPEIYGPAPDSFVADLVSLAGGDPITTGNPALFSISLEALVAADPQVIVLGDAAYGTCPAAVMGRPGWQVMTALKDGAVRPVDDVVVTRPGPRLPDGLTLLALAIHPDAPLQPPAGATQLCTGP
jgi:iron complex transport system substrate-binding protein